MSLLTLLRKTLSRSSSGICLLKNNETVPLELYPQRDELIYIGYDGSGTMYWLEVLPGENLGTPLQELPQALETG